VRAATLPDLGGDDEIALAVREPEVPEDQLFSEERPWRWAGFDGGAEVLVGEVAGPAEVAEAAGDRRVVAHNAKALRTVPRTLAHDTEVAAYLLDPARRGYPLDELAQDHGLGADVDDPTGADALVICALAALQRERLIERGLDRLLLEVELPLVHVLREMEVMGVKLDCALLAQISERVQGEVLELEHEIYRLAGTEFHIGSPQQLAEVLFERLGLSRKRRGKTGYSTDARVLQAIRGEHEIVPKIERYRELTKLAQTYLDALPILCDPRSRLHTTFNQTIATTGRLSSTDPNLQNIPIRTELGREIRAAFVAEQGQVLISADYSQVELRVLAHVADEPVLKEIFRRGEDVHAATAAEVLGSDPATLSPGDRSKAKMINFGIVYGLTGFGLADRLQIPQDEAQEFIDRYLERFPAVRAFIDHTIAFATTEGYVTTLFGRRRQIPELKARQRQVRSLGERLAVNTPIQGSAADIIKVAMVRAHDALRDAGLHTRLILQIHDELLFEAPVDEVEQASAIVVREMERAFPLDPPLAVDVGVGKNWMEAK
jgi:DNA polymerase I